MPKMSSGKFIVADYGNNIGLIITDFKWWVLNENEIKEWMIEFLPKGQEHQVGMTIEFDTAQDRLNFLLRWA